MSSIASIFASKLGIASEAAIKKAEELMRIVESKNTSLSTINLSNTSVAVMCVELAASNYQLSFDKALAIKLSGLQKKNYVKTIRIIGQMLNIKQDMSINNLSIQFGCSEAKHFASKVLKSYQESQPNMDLNEMNLGLFNSASLYIACKKLKLKVDKTKMIMYVGVQRSVFDRLVSHLDPLATNLMKSNSEFIENSESEYSKSLIKNIEDKSIDYSVQSDKGINKNNHDDNEPFHVWKERILQKAKKALNDENK